MKDQKWKYNQKAEDAWQVLRMQSEFIKGFDKRKGNLDAIRKFSYKCFQFNITSNGNLITKNLDILEKIKSQIFSVCTSFDSANADTYKEVRGGKYSLIVDGVKAMIDMGISRVNTSFVVQKKNYLEVLDHYYWCKENGINYGGFSKIDRWPHMGNGWWQENQIDNNPTVDYNFLINALNIIKKDNQQFGLCGGLENLIATKSTSTAN